MSSSSVTSIQPYYPGHNVDRSLSKDTDNNNNDLLFMHWNDFHTKARIELPFEITIPNYNKDFLSTTTTTSDNTDDDDQPSIPTMKNTYRTLDFFVHIPPMYYFYPRIKKTNSKRNPTTTTTNKCDDGGGSTPGGFMASFGAHSTLVGYPTTTSTPTNTTTIGQIQNRIPKKTSIGYSTQCFSLGYIYTLNHPTSFPLLQNQEMNNTNKKINEKKKKWKNNNNNDWGTLLSWIHWDISKSHGSQMLYSFSHYTPKGTWMTDIECINPLSYYYYHPSSIRDSTNTSTATTAIQVTHDMVPHKLYTFLQGHYSTMIDPWKRRNLWIPYYINMGITTSHPSLNYHSSMLSTCSHPLKSSSSSFLPLIEISIECMNDFQDKKNDTNTTTNTTSNNNWKWLSFYEPICKVQIKKTFQLQRRLWKYETNKDSSSRSSTQINHNIIPSQQEQQTSDFYTTDIQIRLSPTNGNLLDISTLFSKTISCLNDPTFFPAAASSSSSPYETMKHGGFILTWGLRSIRKQSITWLLRLDHEDLSLSIPIDFNFHDTTTTTLSTIYSLWNGQNLSIILLEGVYLFFFSHCIQNVFNHIHEERKRSFYNNNTTCTFIENEFKSRTYIPKKSLRDAMDQSQSMKHRADKIRLKENECNGLVIDQAWYYVEGCCCCCSSSPSSEDGKTVLERKKNKTSPCFINVTIPLQFWVQESKLILVSGTKSCLLGFCDLNPSCPTRKKNHGGEKVSITATDNIRRIPGSRTVIAYLYKIYHWIMNDSWSQNRRRRRRHVNDDEMESHPSKYLLSVRYHFNGEQFENTFEDEVEVCLPGL